VIPKTQSDRPTDPNDSNVEAKRAQLAAARARLDDSLHEFSDKSRTLLWRVALPFACGALLSGAALLLFRGRKPRSFALVQFVTQPAPRLPAAPGLAGAALGAGARVVLPQLLELLSQKRGPDEDSGDGPPVAH
jgi:ABC-type cobalamin transport system permease subunit